MNELASLVSIQTSWSVFIHFRIILGRGV